MISLRHVFRWTTRLLVTAIFGLALYGAASADMIGTEHAIDSQRAESAREHIKALARRPDLAEQLKTFGVAPDHAEERVNAMSDAEVLALVDKVGDLPAGGRISDNELILILVLIILVLAL